MKKIVKLFSVLVVFGLAFLSFSVSVANGAYATKAVTLSPMHQKILLVPGEVFSGNLIISNPSDSTEDFDYIIEVDSYYPVSSNDSIDDYGDVNFLEKGDMNMIVDWTSISDPVGTLRPNEERVIPFTVNVPSDVSAGGQYMAIVVRENLSKEDTDNAMLVSEIRRMAHIVYAEVAGDTRKTGEVLDNNLPSFLTSNRLDTTTMVRNTGNVHTDAEYILQVWPLFSDEEVCTNEEAPKELIVLPNTQRYYSQSCNLPAVGIFRAKQTVRIFGEESVVEKTIIVCPIWLLFIILFVIILFVIWIFTRTKSKKSSKKAEN